MVLEPLTVLGFPERLHADRFSKVIDDTSDCDSPRFSSLLPLQNGVSPCHDHRIVLTQISTPSHRHHRAVPSEAAIRASKTMRQTRLDDKENKESSEHSKDVEPEAEDEATAGSKRKKNGSAADQDGHKDEGNERFKSRKTEPSDNQSASGEKQSSKEDAPQPARLAGDQRKADNKLKGDDVEINNDLSGTDDQKSDSASKEVPWHVSEKGLIYFFYRPKVRSADKAESNSTESLGDVQNTFMLLVPRASESDTAPVSRSRGKKSSAEEESDDKRKPPNPTAYRLVSLGKKRMPSPEAALKSGQEPGGIGGRHSEAIWATVADIGAELKQATEGLGEEHYSTKTRGEYALHCVLDQIVPTDI